MNENLRHEIVQQHQTGASVRAIARDLGISRGVVTRVLRQRQEQRDGRTAALPQRRSRPSLIDPFEPILQELLAKYPHFTNARALEELRARGYSGGYTVVRQRLARLRPHPNPAPVPRFETEPGMLYVKQSAMLSTASYPGRTACPR